MSAKFARLDMPHPNDLKGRPVPPTNLYGYLSGDAFVEMFATHAYAGGASEGRQGRVHEVIDGVVEITQANFNAAFLNVSEEELEPGEDTLSLGELREKYPLEES